MLEKKRYEGIYMWVILFGILFLVSIGVYGFMAYAQSPAEPLINLVKTANLPNVVDGSELEYTLEYENASLALAKNVAVVDDVPEGVSYIDGSAELSGGIYNKDTNRVSWFLGDLVSGDKGELTFKVRVDALSHEYTIEFGDPAFFKPQLYDGSFRVTIVCKKNGGEYRCEEPTIGSGIHRAYAYIKDLAGLEVQRFDLIEEGNSTFFQGFFDYDSLTEEMYTLGVYAEDINGVKREIDDYSFFSGQGWNVCRTNSDCLERHTCIDNKCLLDSFDYRLGFVYIYYDQNTYNPDWQLEFESINQKVVDGIRETTNYKVNPTIDILGEVQTDIFCWNPAIIGAKFKNTVVDNEFYVSMPGSSFQYTGMVLGGDDEVVESYCSNCIVNGNVFEMDCEDVLSYANLWESDKLAGLNEQLSQELSFSFDNYDGVYIVFGRLGHVLPEEGSKEFEYRCFTLGGVIGGYSNLIMAGNSLRSGGLIECDKIDDVPFYDKMGWHMMVHEVLHRVGAVDVYDTGTSFGYDPSFYRNRARLIDLRTDESIMGNGDKECIDEGGYEKDGIICTQEELNEIYVDKYNKQKMGVEP